MVADGNAVRSALVFPVMTFNSNASPMAAISAPLMMLHAPAGFEIPGDTAIPRSLSEGASDL